MQLNNNNMNLTISERNILLVSLDHMEEHLFIIYEAGDITLDTFNLRMDTWKTVYNKIKLQ
jgi:hypothetical protein